MGNKEDKAFTDIFDECKYENKWLFREKNPIPDTRDLL